MMQILKLKMIQYELNDLAQDLGISKKASELTSRLNAKNLLEKKKKKKKKDWREI